MSNLFSLNDERLCEMIEGCMGTECYTGAIIFKSCEDLDEFLAVFESEIRRTGFKTTTYVLEPKQKYLVRFTNGGQIFLICKTNLYHPIDLLLYEDGVVVVDLITNERISQYRSNKDSAEDNPKDSDDNDTLDEFLKGFKIKPL